MPSESAQRPASAPPTDGSSAPPTDGPSTPLTCDDPVGSANGDAPPTPRPAPPEATPQALRRLPARLWGLAAVLGAITLVSRVIGLGRPSVLVFDEVYYATQAWEVSRRGVEQGIVVHPPLAKWVMALGVRVLGFNPWGWRVMSLVAGVVVVMATTVVAYRLLGKLTAAAIAGLIVMTDGIAFTTGRLALLDGFVAALTTVALALVAELVARPLDVPLRRRRSIALGVVLGAAIATKWSAIPVMAACIGVVGLLAWRTSTSSHERRRESVRVMGWLVVLPVACYCLTYLPTVIRFDDSSIGRELCGRTGQCDPGFTDRVSAIVRNQFKVLDFHQGLQPRNRYAHNAVAWVFQTEPVVLLSSACPSTDPVCDSQIATDTSTSHDTELGTERNTVRRVVGVGTPIIWMLGTLALIVVLVSALWHLDVRRGLIALWAAVLWLPWVVRLRFDVIPIEPARPGYSFYAAPLVPVIAVSLATCWTLLTRRWRRGAGVALIVIALAGAVVLYPTWTALPTSPGYLQGLVEP